MKILSDRTGYLVERATAGEAFQAFVPNPLPPEPSLELSEKHFDLMEKANRGLGKLDALSQLLPDVSLPETPVLCRLRPKLLLKVWATWKSLYTTFPKELRRLSKRHLSTFNLKRFIRF